MSSRRAVLLTRSFGPRPRPLLLFVIPNPRKRGCVFFSTRVGGEGTLCFSHPRCNHFKNLIPTGRSAPALPDPVHARSYGSSSRIPGKRGCVFFSTRVGVREALWFSHSKCNDSKNVIPTGRSAPARFRAPFTPAPTVRHPESP